MKQFERSYTYNNYSEIPPKLLMVNVPESLIYRITEEYLLQHDFENKERRKPHLSFAEEIHSNMSDSTRTYLKRNNIIINSYNINSLEKLSQLMGYRYFVYFGLYNELSPLISDTSFLYKFEELIKKVTLNQSAFYIVIPDLIFEPSDNMYDVNSNPNTMSENRVIQYYKLISHLIEFYRNVFKYPVYKIIIPTLIDHEKRFNIDLLKIKYRKEIELPRRSLIFYKDFAKVLFDIYMNELEPQDYLFSSDYYVEEDNLIGFLKSKYKDIRSENVIIKTVGNHTEIDTKDYNNLLKKLKASLRK